MVDALRRPVEEGMRSPLPDALVALQSATELGSMVVAGLVLLALGLAGVAVWRGGVSSLLDRVRGPSTQRGDDGETATRRRPDASAESGTDTAAEAETGEATGVETDTTAGTPAPADAEMTDREVVIDILEAHGGQMKQAAIVDETDWSKSKVSMLLSEMEDDGEITKLRVGRENLISISGEEPDAAGSPFDEG